jgi:hypothetical protein
VSVLDPVVTIITIVANLAIGAAGIARAEQVVANARAVGVGPSKVPILGALKAAGAIGLLLGLLGLRPVGIAAAAGLVAFFVGAVVFHVRARVIHNIAFPGTFLVLAIGSLIFAVGR